MKNRNQIRLENKIIQMVREEMESSNLELSNDEIRRMGLSQNAVSDYKKFISGKQFSSKYEAFVAYSKHRAKLMGWQR